MFGFFLIGWEFFKDWTSEISTAHVVDDGLGPPTRMAERDPATPSGSPNSDAELRVLKAAIENNQAGNES